MFERSDVISVYTRAQAIRDGNLMDVTALAAEAGFGVPVAITAAAWSDCVEWDQFDELTDASQSASGRLWDVLTVASVAARLKRPTDRVTFGLSRIPRRGGNRDTDVTLTMVIGPGDTGDTVITIGLAEDF